MRSRTNSAVLQDGEYLSGRRTKRKRDDVLRDGERLRVPLLLMDGAARARPARRAVQPLPIIDSRQLATARHRPGSIPLTDAAKDRHETLIRDRDLRLSQNWRTLGGVGGYRSLRDDWPWPLSNNNNGEIDPDNDDDDDDDDLDDDDPDNNGGDDDDLSPEEQAEAAREQRKQILSNAWRTPPSQFQPNPLPDLESIIAGRVANALRLGPPSPFTMSRSTTAVSATPTGQPSQPTGSDARDAARQARDERLANAWRSGGDATNPDAATAIERQRERVAGRGGPL